MTQQLERKGRELNQLPPQCLTTVIYILIINILFIQGWITHRNKEQ